MADQITEEEKKDRQKQLELTKGVIKLLEDGNKTAVISKAMLEKYAKEDKETDSQIAAALVDAIEESGAETLEAYNEMMEMDAELAKEAKKRSQEEKREAFALRKELIQNGITDEDFLSNLL